MRIDGQYKLSLKTPVGEQQGMMSLKTDGTTLSGNLQNTKGEVAFSGGSVQGNQIAFDTRIPTPIGKLKAHVTGQVSGTHFSGLAKLPLGSAQIEGDRIS
ncbi:hypothetical protein VK792_08940 [Mesobacterium sp. TK19101]|uniref:Uncharacterized protein n=1 Tax=Mesobacterium hydrothermale TaxID=3111907 RepID=A0ABU6HG19_9RHOB|nr:hypothetical protein [Mesobacterium sp. TK19101]MEC3861407.1 hypothetical protein [Mesobacterium sp. TK19101]